MTEKRKRGRPPGSGSKNKPKIDKGTRPVTGQSIVASINSSLSKFAHLKNQPKQDGGFVGALPAVNAKDCIIKEGFNDIANGRNETPYPSNWESLSKVAKLQWLTANRQK
jgi:hypothetical protein